MGARTGRGHPGRCSLPLGPWAFAGSAPLQFAGERYSLQASSDHSIVDKVNAHIRFVFCREMNRAPAIPGFVDPSDLLCTPYCGSKCAGPVTMIT